MSARAAAGDERAAAAEVARAAAGDPLRAAEIRQCKVLRKRWMLQADTLAVRRAVLFWQQKRYNLFIGERIVSAAVTAELLSAWFLGLQLIAEMRDIQKRHEQLKGEPRLTTRADCSRAGVESSKFNAEEKQKHTEQLQSVSASNLSLQTRVSCTGSCVRG